jgi:arabinogalactan oligomer/maltooligosaccharide transport system permease protein
VIPAPLLLATQLVLWHSYSGHEERALEAVVQTYNQAHMPAGVSVLPVGIPHASLPDKLKAGVPRGNGPDIFLFAHDIVGEWSRFGLLRPISPSDPPGKKLDGALAELLPRTVEALRSGGKLWGVPLSFKSLALFYRTDLVPSPPRSTDELLALCARLRGTEKDRRYGLAYQAGETFFHAVWLHGFGGSFYPGGGAQPRLTGPEAERALAFVGDLVRRGDIPDEMSGVLVAQFFNEGRAATVLSGPWFLSQIEPKVPFAVAPLPRVSVTGKPAASLTTVEGGFITPLSKHPAEAARFLAYLAGPDASRVRALMGRQLVTNTRTWADPAVSGDPILAAFYAGHDDMVPTDSRPEMGLVWEPMNQALRKVLRGARAPAEALSQAQQQLDIYLRPVPQRAPLLPYGILLAGLLLLFLAALVFRLRDGRVLRQAWRERGAYPYLLPAAASMAFLVFVPFAVGAGMSMFVVDPEGRWRFVGLANFANILLCRETAIFDPLSFYYTLPVTVLWTVLNVSMHVILGAGLALLLRDPLLRLRGVYRMLLLVPWAVPNYITALIWKGMFNRQFGAVNGILVWLGMEPVSWFSRFWTALCANVTTNVWLGFPFMMVVTLGALSQVPREVEEAAVLDGANRWQRLRHVVLPILWPQLLPSVLLGSVWTFNMFNIVFLVSGGEPDGATEILVSQAYRWAFTRGHRYGYAAAYAVLIFVVLIFQSALMRRVSDRR